jgi:hypothetical protein
MTLIMIFALRICWSCPHCSFVHRQKNHRFITEGFECLTFTIHNTHKKITERIRCYLLSCHRHRRKSIQIYSFRFRLWCLMTQSLFFSLLSSPHYRLLLYDSHIFISVPVLSQEINLLQLNSTAGETFIPNNSTQPP